MEPIAFTIEEEYMRVAQRFSTALRPLGFGVINSSGDDGSYYGEVYGASHHLVAIIRIAQGKSANGTITIVTDDDRLDWPSVLRDIEESAYKPPAELSAEEIIAKYYMRRGRNKKLTLRQHLIDVGTDLSEGYIRNVKLRYDKRHKARKDR